MRNFLWTSTDTVQKGKCAAAWSTVQKPLPLGGLGIPDFKKEDKAMKAFFDASITCVVGDGSSTLFWTDLWLDGQRLGAMAPDLVAAVNDR
jgi:hypothetical protein